MEVKITPAALSGSVIIPPSKSAAHRALICAALSRGESRVTPYCTSKDIRATVSCLKALGMDIEEDRNGYTLSKGKNTNGEILDFNESGSTARFLLPIAAALGANVTATGSGRLPERPMDTLTTLFRQHGVKASSDNLPITLNGKLTGGDFCLPGNISSQFISGLLMAAPLIGEEVNVIPTTALESVGYIDMTISAMKKYGVNIEETNNGWRLPKGSRYAAANTVIEGDWSQAAFFMSAAAIGGDIKIHGLDFASLQGDMAALDVFAAFGANISVEDGVLHVRKGGLHGIEVNAANIPDMVPAIAATAAFAKGKTVIHSAERLRIKESDRIKTTIAALNAMGIKTEERADGMVIYGGNPVGAQIDGANDHRIVMAFSVAAAYAQGESTITGAGAINKSYPEFFEDLKGIGGKLI
ncbi:MAG: 3-phosphoshikimate 1-carboxyvinyltransferase [Clostridia bacterium]|nr:3-phosphoshikimate 1-carboxyvinyltransferase [Clostridia bacterium]